MAHNAYYPPPTPLGQQPPIHPQPGSSPGGHQYAQHPQQQYHQQPQNIYQQLGQAQPQPHLQRLYQQQQGQYAQQPAPPAQPVGYGQQQSHGFVQRPLSTSFQPPQHAYAPPTTPFQQPPPAQQQPYPPSQQYVTNQYTSSTLQQPPRPPISRTPSAQGFVQPNTYAGQGYMAPAPQQQELNPPVMASMVSQQLQRRSPQPPPPAPSALLAQQTRLQRQPSQAPSTISQGHPQPVQMQMRQQPPAAPQSHVMQMQQRQPPQMPPPRQQQQLQHSQFSQQRRPLPQPSGDDPNPPPSGLVRSGTVASRPLSMPPTLAPISTSHSMFNREPSPQPTLGQPMSASSIPPPSFVQRQIQQIQAMQAQKQHAEGMVGSSSSSGPIGPQSSSSGSPVKSRPLPAAPGSQAKRATVDLGRVSGLPNVNNGSGFAFSSSPNATSNGLSGSTSGSEELSSSRKGFPTASSGGTSRTTVMAALDNDSTPTKRASGRASPPKFASSTSSSPAKEEAKSPWSNSSPSKPSNVFGGPKNISTPDLSASSLGKHPVSPGSTSTATTPTKKFTPVWKRTIPDYPAPVFGYAAGMVADPFAKPNASSTSVSSSPSKSNETPKATKVLTEKERKKLDKEEKKKAKEEEKQRKKMVKRGIAVPPTTGNASAAATPVRQPASVSANKPSPSQLPYLNPTPPRVGAPGEYSKAYAHGQLQHQHLMARGAAVGYGQGQQTSSQQSTPTRQIQVRGQPVQASASGTSPSAATRYSMPLAKQESSTEEDEAEDDDEDDEDESDQDVEQAYQYEGSDYSEETSEQEYAVPMSRKAREQKQREEEERQYQEYLAQQQRAKEKAKKSGGSSPGRYQDEYERPSPTSRHGHVKSRSSASDGFVVVSQSQPSGRNGPRPAHSRTQSYHTNYSNSEDDWEQLQSYEASPEEFKATPTTKTRAKEKGRRYQEPSEEEDGGGEEEEEEAESAEEELRRRYMAKRKRERAQAKAQAEAEAQKQAEAEAQAREQARGSRHRREASERETVRKFQREPEYEYESDPRVQNSTAKQSMQGRGMREKVQDIDWGRQEQPQDRNAPRKYQQQLKYDGDDDDGRGREKTKVKRRASLKELFSSRSKSRSRHAEPEEEEEDYSRQKASSSPTKKPSQPTRKLVKKGSRKVMANSETESNDDDSVATEESTTKTLASRFASVMKLSGSQPQRPQQPQHQKTPSQTQSQSQAKRQSGFSPGGSGSLYFGILDEPDTPASASPASAKANSVMSNRAPSRVRGEVNRSKIGLKVDNLDDPPPRSLRTPSPSPSGPPKRQSMYQYPTGTDQRPPQSRQIDSQQRPRPQSQIYPATAKSSFMDDVPHNQQGSGSEILQPKRRELPQQPPQHPQSQSRSRPQSQNFQQQQNPMTFDAATGLPVHHQQAMQGYAPPPQRQLSRAPSQRQLYNNSNNDARSVPSVPSTPRQQQPINIESPAPLKMANILKMEEDGAAQERRQEEFQQRFSPQNLPSINLHHTGQQQFQGQHPSINVQHTGNHQNQQPYQNQPNAPLINVGSPPDSTASSPRIGVHHTGRTDMTNGTHQMIPIINFDTMPSSPPANPGMPSINISEAPPSPTNGNGRPPPQIFEVPGISVSGQFDDGPSNGAPQISVSTSGDNGHNHNNGPQSHQHPHPHQPQQARFVNGRPTPARSGTGGLICGGCQGPIVGRIVSAMGVRWHPNCFKCSVCSELLEHVSSYEHDGRPYCHLDYHENFAPRCYSCKTPIIEEQFISLDDPALGKRTYHMEHFFCAECGDPFLTPSMSNTSGELALSGDGDFEGFTVYKGHPYCEPCHVRLRLPKCKKCKKSIRDHDRAVEALGGKWCWTCFVCEGCNQPFDDPSFFQRDGHPYCEHCFSIILRNEM